MKSTHRLLALILAALLMVMGLPAGAVADEPGVVEGEFLTGLLPSVGDFPDLDASQFGASLQALPSRIDLSAGLPPVGSQGAQGSCVGWTLGYYYKTYQERLERGWDVTRPDAQFSPAYIYNQRNTSNCSLDGGMTYANGFRILQETGAATLAAFPYDPSDPCTQPSQAVRAAAWPYRIASYQRIFGGKGNADLQVLKGLLASGEPFAIAVPVYSSFYRVTKSDPVVPRPADGETFYGGHAMLVVGYDDQVGGFLAVNSWGTGWGRDGYAYLSYAFVQHDTWEAWLMVDHVERHDPPMTLNGEVRVGASLAAASEYTVSAFIEGTLVAQTVTSSKDGRMLYNLSIPADDPNTSKREGGRPGDKVTFKVSEVAALESTSWDGGQVLQMDLHLAETPLPDAAPLHRLNLPLVRR